MNKAYLDSIRADSCYPTFRAFVAVSTVLAYIVAALVLAYSVAGLVLAADYVSRNGGKLDVASFVRQGGGIFIGIVVAVVIVLIAKVGQEVSLMIADIADATIDSAGHRNQSASVQDSLNKPSPSGLSTKSMEKGASPSVV